MYSKYYGFSHKPFELSPDPDLIYLSETHQEALSVLLYGVYNRKGFLQISGDVGTGKSTLVQALIGKLENNVHLCHIPNPNFTVEEFYFYISVKFGLDEFDGNKAKFILNLAEFLKQCREKNEFSLLIIDEAQVLSLELLEEIRLLSNQEYTEFGVLSIFFIGQPELNVLLKQKKMDPLRNRIGIRFNLDPLTLDETVAYIQFRLRKAGRTVLLFSQRAFQEIHKASGGIPRSINILCDNALLSGFAEQRGVIDENIIIDCAKELEQSDVDNAPSDGDKISREMEPELISPEPFLKDDDQDKKKVKPNKLLRKIAFAFVMICALFFAMMYTTQYWGKLPGTNSAKAWFENLHVDETIIKKIKELFIARKSDVKLNSAEINIITEKVISPEQIEIRRNPDGTNYVFITKQFESGPLDKSFSKYDEIIEPIKATQKSGKINYVSISNQVGGANIRSGPSMMENILRIVAPGYPFRVIDQQEDWSLVEDFKNRKGWVASKIIIEYNTVILKSDKVNLLSGPGYHNDIVANIDYGTVMQVEKKQDRWLKVYKGDGVGGWIHEDMVWP